MGCDIHIILEHRNPKALYSKEWDTFGFHALCPGRDYTLFGRLSGVRTDSEETPLATPGLPDDISWVTKRETRLYVSSEPDGGDGYCSLSRAMEWIKRRMSTGFYDASGKLVSVTHPDWHSFGHCSIEKMTKALRGRGTPSYRALLAAARSYARDGHEVRFIIFYDN